MKFNKIIYALSAVALLLGTSSCKDFLDKETDTRVDLNTVDKARMLLNDAYPAYSVGVPCELSSDNVVDNNATSSEGYRYNLTSYARTDDETFAFEEVKSGSGSDTPSGIWTSYYGAIASANACLEALDQIQARVNAGESVDNASQIPAIRGEALLLRAFSAFMLSEVFCMPYRGPELSKTIVGLPYPTVPETTVKPHYERLDLATYYDMIEKDIKEGLPLIDNSIYAVPKYHFNKAAAYSFAARFYLSKRDYPKVLEYCNTAFGGENVDPSQYMSDIWAHLADMFYIKDMGLYYNGTDKNRNFLLIPQYTTTMRRYTGGRRYALNDIAKRATVQGGGPTWESFNWKPSNGGKTYSMHPCMNGACGVNGSQQYGVYFGASIAEQFEYTNKIAGIGYCHNTNAEFNGEETLFMRAEAKLFLGDRQGAIDDLRIWELSLRTTPNAAGIEDRYKELSFQTIRAFYLDKDPGYGIVKDIHIDEVNPSDQYSLAGGDIPVLQCIQHFRRIVFVHTGKRFFDLKRYGIEWEHIIGKENRVEKISLWDPRRAIQIPSEVISAGFEPNSREIVSKGDTSDACAVVDRRDD